MTILMSIPIIIHCKNASPGILNVHSIHNSNCYSIHRKYYQYGIHHCNLYSINHATCSGDAVIC